MNANGRKPWLVEDLDDFYFLCCPECAYKSKDDGVFMDHAIENHPKSKESSLFSGPEEELNKQKTDGSMKKGVKVISLPINLASIDIPQKDIEEENQLVDMNKSAVKSDNKEDGDKAIETGTYNLIDKQSGRCNFCSSNKRSFLIRFGD